MAKEFLGNIRGPKGEDGRTPVKGEDYFTEEDIKYLASCFLTATESSDHPGCYYRTAGNEIEWINPPLAVGVEYRTVERFMGSAVYKQAVDCGEVPSATEKVTPYYTPAGKVASVIRCWGHSGKGIALFANSGEVCVSSNSDASDATVVTIVEYTKEE